ncbi:galactoside alpha-(1,2)-fucosyltransferase 1-like [Amphibalanus amphitrite]|uniref:galactoside alpha-(1,2)-fucosyltransferase 1-like n=1 Tax=Amphibalanus amphitrite TaxID=1232801 RepID=UPI001C916417|nr:galactoside alpha-(1,2)-fucosyltransferase 1-like [Amphibalanus amphitrite]
MYGLFWMLVGGQKNSQPETNTLPPAPTGTPAQEAAYERALAEIASFTSTTDEYGCPGAALVTIGTDWGTRSLGDALFDYATLWSFSRQFGLRGWLLPTAGDRLAAHFGSVSLPTLPPHCEPRFQRCTMVADNCRRMRDKRNRNIWIDPESRDASLLDAFRLELRRELELFEPPRRAAQLRLSRLLRRCGRDSVTPVGVHVSSAVLDPWLVQGDDDSDNSAVAAGYIRRAMAHYRRILGDCLFVAVCDEPEWCSEHLRAPDVVVTGGGGPDGAMADLALLTACRHTVMTAGPFGFMAGILAGGHLVAPANVSDPQLGLVEPLRQMKNLNITLLNVFGD